MNRIALCFELPALRGPTTGAELGEIQLIPAPDADGRVTGRDGRSWLWDDAARAELQRQFAVRGLAIVIDREHATELRAPEGEEAPAAGWVTELDIRADGSAWGRADWTPRGAEQVRNREYRYISPVFDYDPQSGRIARLVSVGLVNKPNLRLPALNREEEPPMKLSAALAVALGLPADTATEADGIAAIGSLKTDLATARNAEQAPSLERFVPRADYDAVLSRANNAERQLQDAATAAHTTAVEAEISAALKAGKITPAAVDYHRASCADSEGLERFRQFVSAAPVIAPDGVAPAGGARTDTALNADEQRIAELCGISREDFGAARAALTTASA